MKNFKKVFILLLLNLATLLSFFLVWYEYHKISELSKVGKLINAEVTYKYAGRKYRGDLSGRKIIKQSKLWDISYNYQPDLSLKKYTGNTYVSKATFDELCIGSTIEVTYNPNKRFVSYAGDVRNISSTRIFRYTKFPISGAIILFFITIFYILYLLFFHRVTKYLNK